MNQLSLNPPLSRLSRRYAYERVSKKSQSIDRQTHGLRNLCDELHTEYISAGAKSRPVFESLLGRMQSGDTFIVWDLDRAFRSTIDALMTLEELFSRGVHFEIVSMKIDTRTAEGELFYTIAAAFARFERRMIARRTREGLEAARRRGVILGRPISLSVETVLFAYDSVTKDNLPCRYVAALLSVSRITLQRAFKREGLTPPHTLQTTSQKPEEET